MRYNQFHIDRRFVCFTDVKEYITMATVELRKETQEFLNTTVPGDQDLDTKIRQLIEEEYLRRLGRYRRTDLALTRKYGMTFDEFIARSIPRQRDYSWEVEQDAMDWETAVDGMATIERKLRKLREFPGERTA
jgi:hypothetical protein